MIYKDKIRERLEDISYLELKEGASVKVGEEKFYGYLPLPILNSRLVDLVKETVEDIPGEYFLEGMIYVLSLDFENEYAKQYIDFIKSYTKDIKGYLFSKGVEFVNKEDYMEGIIYLDALRNLDLADEKVYFALGTALENLDITIFTDLEKTNHAIDIMNTYEKVLNIDDEFSLAHYKLGYIYREFGQFVKAKLSFEKFLNLDKNDFRLQEVREVLEDLESETLREEAILEMNSGNYENALEKLLKVNPNKRDDLFYYHLSLCYGNLKEYDASLDAINIAIEMEDISIYHNQKAIAYQGQGHLDLARAELENALEKFGTDYYLNFNLGTILYNQGNTEEAIENFEEAYRVEPSEELLDIINQLENALDSN
ncbi:MAG: tetratricopeptide repeat protein [Tissierellia bacterium]|nr:tetratricopeptide repeat protein [Tissierellia bacterium]